MKRSKHSPTQCYNNFFLKWTQRLSREFRGSKSIYDSPGLVHVLSVIIQHIAPGAVSSDPQALLFSHRGGLETRVAREWLVTKRKELWEGEKWEAKRCLTHFPLPAFLCAEIFIEGDDARHKTLVRHFNERLTCDQEVLLPFFFCRSADFRAHGRNAWWQVHIAGRHALLNN